MYEELLKLLRPQGTCVRTVTPEILRAIDAAGYKELWDHSFERATSNEQVIDLFLAGVAECSHAVATC